MAGCAPNTPTCNSMFTMTVGRSQQVGRWCVPVRSAGPTEHLLCANSVRGQDGGGNRWAHSSASVLGGSGDQLCDSATWHLVNAISLTTLITRCNYTVNYTVGFPDSSFGKESACNAGDPVLIPGSGRSPGKGIGYPLQYTGLEKSMDCIVLGSQRVRHNWATFTFHHQIFDILSKFCKLFFFF